MHGSMVMAGALAVSMPAAAQAPSLLPDAARETIIVSKTDMPCAGFCFVYRITVMPDGQVFGIAPDVKTGIDGRPEPTMRRIALRVSPAEAARFRAILHPYRPAHLGPAPAWVRAAPLRPPPDPLPHVAPASEVEIDWDGLGPSPRLVLSSDEPTGAVAAVDAALRAIHLDSRGREIPGAQ